jgi:hypothetical protein
MKFLPSLCTLLVLSLLFPVHADLPVVDDDPVFPNLRFAWNLDLDGGVDGDEWNGFEVAYGSQVYPLDQMLVSYAHANRGNNASHDVMLAFEEYYALSPSLVPYGIAGIGFRFVDHAEGEPGDSRGWFAKVGGGLILKTSESFSVFGEIAYHGSDRDLWKDSGDADSQNWVGLLGVRLHY